MTDLKPLAERFVGLAPEEMGAVIQGHVVLQVITSDRGTTRNWYFTEDDIHTQNGDFAAFIESELVKKGFPVHVSIYGPGDAHVRVGTDIYAEEETKCAALVTALCEVWEAEK